MSMSQHAIGLKTHLRLYRPQCASEQRPDPRASGRECPCGRDTSATSARLAGALPAPARARRAERPAPSARSRASSAFGPRLCAAMPARDLTPGRKSRDRTTRDVLDSRLPTSRLRVEIHQRPLFGLHADAHGGARGAPGQRPSVGGRASSLPGDVGEDQRLVMVLHRQRGHLDRVRQRALRAKSSSRNGLAFQPREGATSSRRRT
jgi:hypothetical protein